MHIFLLRDCVNNTAAAAAADAAANNNNKKLYLKTVLHLPIV